MKERIYGIIGCFVDFAIQVYLSVSGKDLRPKKEIEDPTEDAFR